MNNLKFLFALLLTSSFFFTGCFIDVDDDDGLFGCMNADGPIVTADLAVPTFDGIELAMDARVEITQGDELLVTVEGKSDILDEIDLDVRNGVWTIHTKDCVRNVDNLTFFITMPELQSAKISGSGKIISTNVLTGGDVNLHISGSGELDLALEVDDIDAEISGSGKLFLEGAADDLDLNISGSGDFRGFALAANHGDIRITGSGDAEVRTANTLKVRILGSGDVYYKGQPTLDVSITGSGSVIDAN